jgi:hypothetical protein
LIFGYGSVLFHCPEVFTEHGLRPSRHGHRECAMGCPGGTMHTGGSGWPVVSSMRQGGEHGQRGPWAGGAGFRRTKLGLESFGQVG